MVEKKKTSTTAPTLNVLSLIGLILGIVALSWGIVPFFNFIAIPIAIAAIIIGIVAINYKNNNNSIGRKGFSITAIITGSLGLLIAIIWTIGILAISNSELDYYNDYPSADDVFSGSSSTKRN